MIPDGDVHKFAVAPDRDGDVDASRARVLAMLDAILHQGLEKKRWELSDFGPRIATNIKPQAILETGLRHV